MTDLTEKWKNGELEDGMYYMENTSGIIGRVGHSKAFPCYNVKQILAPVPSYETYLTMKDCAKMVFEAAERETKLKELLKECRDVAEFTKTIVNKHKWFDEVITKIDEVLE